MAYIPTYTPSDISKIPVDIIGTGLTSLKGYTPLIVLGGVGYLGAKRISKFRKKYYKYKKRGRYRNFKRRRY